MVLDFRVLGPAEVTADGHPVPLGGSRPLIVLAGLLLRANRVVPVDELGRWLWDDDRRRSKGALQTYVLRLRRALGDQVTIRTESGGYLIELDDDLLDLSRFRARATQGKAAMDRGESRRAAAYFAEALAQWRGPALLNVESDALHRDEVGQLAEERLRVREQWADALLDVGEYGTVVPELTRLTRENPLRERLHEQLMVALYRSGRQAEALEVYRRISGVLAEELGLDPGPSLQRTRQAILTGAAGEDVTGAARPARYRLGVEPQVPHQLPADLPTFSGRECDLKALHALLPEAIEADTSTPIASVEGMGGIGKTTLAVHFAHEVADRFPGGQVYLNLRGYGPGEPVEPSAALEAMLTALGVPCEAIPADLDGRAASWRTHTAGRRLLVLLDNANRTEQVRPLLPGPGCLVVITSRWQLRALAATHGARRIALEELGEEDAVELLASTIGLERVARDPAATERFVRHCGGLPLAIRILAVRAAQFPDLPLDEFVDSLPADLLGSFDLADGEGTNIRSVFSYSYQALEPSTARLLRLLGLPTGVDFTAPAAAAVAGQDLAATRPMLETLAAAHLLAQPRPGRYQFHDLIRAYAGEVASQVDSPSERDAALDRLLDWYLASALNASRRMRPERYYRLLELDGLSGGQTFSTYHDALDWFGDESGNLIAAVHLARRRRDDVCWKLAWLLQSYFVTRSRLDDWRSVFEVALEAARAIGHRPGEAGILSGLGVVNGVARQYDESRRYLEQVLTIQRELGAREGEARAQYNLSMVAHNLDDYAWAYEHGMQALEIVRELGLGAFEASVLRALGDICTSMGDHEQALRLADAALAILGPDGEPVDTRFTLHTRGLALVGLGRVAEGIEAIRESVSMFFAMGEHYEAADVLAQLGTIHVRHGEPALARECWLRSVRLLTELGHPDADDVRAKLAALVGSGSGSPS
ncbi:AfsR/SARP family transcriptional regulator [Amycolatopsis australiensis]|uniref:DNA-binding transcriptional activator of the SARP family n=1 Tax=Amycolatopsis australiensis TaxID=546364 RepID=A0A1K1QNQ9_9PSEU|nr:BTAD domain-containing putative transcriptional regulator [Amycolatopsis australiensis]SFW61397.1 DNA-binding transcriptional activator of the SARP family [Amycolatopsis australiensis]